MSSDSVNKVIVEQSTTENAVVASHEGLINLASGRVALAGGILTTGITVRISEASTSNLKQPPSDPTPEEMIRHKAKASTHTHEEDVGESVLHVRDTLRDREVVRSPYEARSRRSDRLLPDALEDRSSKEIKHRRSKSQPPRDLEVASSVTDTQNAETVDRLFKEKLSLKESQAMVISLFQGEKSLNHRRFLHKVKKLMQKIEESSRKPQSLMGCLIFISSSYPKEMVELLSSDDPLDSMNRIETSATLHFQEIRRSAASLNQDHELSSIQSGKVAYYNKLTSEIAKTLITKEGRINKLLIDPLVAFLSDHQPLCNHEYSLLDALRLLKQSETLQQKIESIKTPSSSPETPLEIIRIQCGLPTDSTPSANDMKTTLLSALLSHPRQGNQGSCFASYLSIALLSAHKIKTADDLISILEKGKLSRKTGRVKRDFPFLFRIGDGALYTSFTIDKSGFVLKGGIPGGPLEKIPGLIAAARYLGFENPAEALKSASFLALADSGGQGTLNSFQILKQLSEKAHALPGNRETTPLKLLLKACYCFDGEVHNPLIRAFESCLADMAEASNQGMIKQPVLFSIIDPVQDFLSSNTSVKDEDKTALISEMQGLLLDRIHLSYDLDVNRDTSPDNNNVCNGGFILHDTKRSSSSSDWMLIGNPEQFKAFAQDILQEAKKKMEVSAPGVDWAACCRELSVYLKGDQFIKNALISFYPDNGTVADMLDHWIDLPYTPWRIISGNLAPNVRDIYMESESDDHDFHHFKVTDALSLLALLVDLAKSLPVYSRFGFLERREMLLPVFTDVHAFNLCLAHPKFREIIIRNTLPIKWIKDHYLKAARALSEERMTENEKSSLLSKLSLALSDLSIGSSWQEAFLPGKETTLRLVREACLKAVTSPDQELYPTRERIVDQALLSAMPERLKTTLLELSIPFADTNWNDGRHDILLCFAPHPGCDKIAVFEMKDDGEILRFIRPGLLLNENLSIPKNPDIQLPPSDPPHRFIAQ